MEGEYSGEVLRVPLSIKAEGQKTVTLGRSSSCDVTLGRDDQISRKHLQIDVCDGKLLVRDLGYDGVGAELGVLRGDFSLQLLRHTRLSTLLLVDVWAPLPGDPSWRVAIGERDDDDDSQLLRLTLRLR